MSNLLQFPLRKTLKAPSSPTDLLTTYQDAAALAHRHRDNPQVSNHIWEAIGQAAASQAMVVRLPGYAMEDTDDLDAFRDAAEAAWSEEAAGL